VVGGYIRAATDSGDDTVCPTCDGTGKMPPAR
jgi:hypothetical protein